MFNKMDILKSIELVGSLIAANIVLSVIIGVLIFLLFRRKKTYVFYRKNIRKPIIQFNLALRKSVTSTLPNTPEGLLVHHMADFNYCDHSDDPYVNTILLSNEQKRKFCEEKIEKIRKRTVEYFPYTNCRIKPFDVNELEIYKRELSKLETYER